MDEPYSFDVLSRQAESSILDRENGDDANPLTPTPVPVSPPLPIGIYPNRTLLFTFLNYRLDGFGQAV